MGTAINVPGRALAHWHRDGTIDGPSSDPNDATNRILDGYARIALPDPGRPVDPQRGILSVGPCLAREFEINFSKLGVRTLSLPRFMHNHPAFEDRSGEPRWEFIHRYTPRAIAQDFAAAFGELEGWNHDEALIVPRGGGYEDLANWRVDDAPDSIEAIVHRRYANQIRLRSAAEAGVIFVLLSSAESWRERGTGFDVTYYLSMGSHHRAAFDFTVLTASEVTEALERLYATIERHHETGDFKLVFSVTPGPMLKTYSGDDVIVANCLSKAMLRAGVEEMCRRHSKVRYFPCLEYVQHSDPDITWKPDRIHVQVPMAQHLAREFASAYFLPLTPVPDSVWTN